MEEAHESHNSERTCPLRSESCSAGGDGLAGRCGGLFGPGQGGPHFRLVAATPGAVRPDHFEFATLWPPRDGAVWYVWSNSKFYVCHGSTKTWVQTNLNGLNAAVSVTPVSPGSQCPTGGSSIAFGLDLER